MVWVPAVVNVVVSAALAETPAAPAGFATSVAVHGGVPQVEKVTVPVGAFPNPTALTVTVIVTGVPAWTAERLTPWLIVVAAVVTVTTSVTGPLGL